MPTTPRRCTADPSISSDERLLGRPRVGPRARTALALTLVLGAFAAVLVTFAVVGS